MAVIAAGQPAPEFSLATLRGRAVHARATCRAARRVLVFYPFAFSPVCTDQLSVYNELLDDFAERGRDALRRLLRRDVVAAGVQGAARRSTIEQLSDFEPKGAACRAFGVLHPGGFPQRALVLIGPDARRALELRGRRRPATCPART